MCNACTILKNDLNKLTKLNLAMWYLSVYFETNLQKILQVLCFSDNIGCCVCMNKTNIRGSEYFPN